MESEIQRLGGDILKHPRYLQLLQFQHHGAENSVYDHSVAVAQAAYAIARRMRLSLSLIHIFSMNATYSSNIRKCGSRPRQA